MALLKIIREWFSIPNSVTVYALLTILFGILLTAAVKRLVYIRRVDRVPGMPGGLTILGNTPLVIGVSPDELFTRVMGYVVSMRSKGPVLRAWAGPFPIFFLFTVEAFEAVLSSNKLIDKSREYAFLHPWLNTGLLTSTGSKWQSRRKMLTPTFHFKILEDFVQVFNDHSATLIAQLRQALAKENDFNLYPYITRCTLDIICDTAMGCNIKAQTQSDTEYVQAVYAMSRIVQTRQAVPWFQIDALFNMSALGAEQRKSLRILHNFTDKVIQERKAERQQHKAAEAISSDSHDDNFFSKKKRLAFLDLLIDASQEGAVLSDRDIREEVDTFMFEGHDTTTAAINWSLLLIGSHPRVQELVDEELKRVFGDSDRPITMADLSELKYLECCIKEALRLYPSVPIMGRKLSEDTDIHGYDVPGNTTVLLLTYMLHRDPQHFPDPELYQPERFFPENSRGRHPYAYVPFSAGARNCIGQKFALMEEKVILASILRHFHIDALDRREELILLGELILRPRDGIRFRLTAK